MIPLTVYYRRNETDPRKPCWYTFALSFVLAGAAGAGSRSGLIGGALAIVGTMVTRPGLSRGRRVPVGLRRRDPRRGRLPRRLRRQPGQPRAWLRRPGAGRLDFWAVTIALIKERPDLRVTGSASSGRDPAEPADTPGSAGADRTREDVSAHNTWLDILGDLGRRRADHLGSASSSSPSSGSCGHGGARRKELSTTLFVMMLPGADRLVVPAAAQQQARLEPDRPVRVAAGPVVGDALARLHGRHCAARGRGPAVATRRRRGGSTGARCRPPTIVGAGRATRGGRRRDLGARSSWPAGTSQVSRRFRLRARGRRWWPASWCSASSVVPVPTRYIATGGHRRARAGPDTSAPTGSGIDRRTAAVGIHSLGRVRVPTPWSSSGCRARPDARRDP